MAKFKYPLARPYFSKSLREKICADIDGVLESGQLMMGPFQDKFERAFAELAGTPHAVSVNTCTTALTICLQYFGAKDHEVLVPSGAFVTDVSAVLFAGGTPVLVDMNPETLSFDLEDLERKRTGKTKGVIWVHLTGVISDEYREIMAFAKKHDLFLLEDAAHAHGGEIDGHKAGSLGDAGCFSFFPTKVLTSGTGGIITTSDEKLKQFATEQRLFGKNQETGDIDKLGNDWFLDEIRCCVAYHQTRNAGDIVSHRRRLAAAYDDALANQPGVRCLNIPSGSKPAYYQYPVFVDSGLDIGVIQSRLASEFSVQAKPIYLPTHQEAVFQEFDTGTLKNTEQALQRSMCLPLHLDMTTDDVKSISDALVTIIRSS
ncbi:MAG: DegT/DnrJ/EryC1/StrS family aminotransferase [Rhodospirillaceae bacterium]|jgi:perosamine synthetase|nr:DegT/DnrJ/EryC1/StrS family aminotransferase [Rhodospirillaceae bacterium]